MSRRVVDVVGLLQQFAARRTDLARAVVVNEADDAVIGELAVITALVEAYASDNGYEDPTDTTRPGVLLVGAGVRGDVTLRADLEALNLELVSDRDLAVYGGLLGHVVDRLADERARRQVERHLGALPARYALGVPQNFTDGGDPQ